METANGFAILPIKTEFAGPAPKAPGGDYEDVIDEALNYFRASILFKHFEVKGPADKTFIYLTCFICKCLETIQKSPEQDAATKAIFKLSMEPVTSGSSSSFFMKDLVKYSAKEDDKFKKYLLQSKQECASRLMQILYNPEWGTLDLKFWLAFAKKKFLNRSFN